MIHKLTSSWYVQPEGILMMDLFKGVYIPKVTADETQWWQNVTIKLHHKWKAEVFYDHNELYYVECLIDPNGTKHDEFWHFEDSRFKWNFIGLEFLVTQKVRA